MTSLSTLYPDQFYHIYNRGNNHRTVFSQDYDYRLFLERMPRYILPVAKIYAYCLLPNHFHLLIQVRAKEQLLPFQDRFDGPLKLRHRGLPDFLSDQFSNWFNSFTRSINNRYNWDGNLFKRPFQRKEITTESYLLNTLRYIHRNPEYHGLCADFKTWKYSGYQAILSGCDTWLERDEVLGWFGGVGGFRAFHEGAVKGMDEEWVTFST